MTIVSAGLREAAKADKLRRIKAATKTLLVAHGYEVTTTREIARLARVSIGTVFVYAKDKRDLLYLVINDELDPVATGARAAASPAGAPLDRVCAYLRPWYDYFAANLGIGRCAFRELAYYQHHFEDVGPQATRLRARMRGQEERLAEIINEARASGHLVSAGDPTLIASALYDIYQVEIRGWVYGAAPDVEAGLARLRAKLDLILAPLAADAKAVRPPHGARATILRRGMERLNSGDC